VRLDELRAGRRIPDRAMAALFDAALGMRVRNSSYRNMLKRWDEEISNQLATSDLRAMVKAGLLTQHGTKRGTFYQGAEPIQQVRAEIRAGRQPIDASSVFELAAA